MTVGCIFPITEIAQDPFMCLMIIYESSFVKCLLKSFEKKSIAYFFIFIFCQDFFINLEYMYFKKFFICECAHTAVCVYVFVCVGLIYIAVLCVGFLYIA